MTTPARRATTPATRPAVHYGPLPELTPAERAELVAYRRHAAQQAARREQDRILHARWRQRQAAIAERDGRTRKVLLGLGITVGVGVLAGLTAAVWLIWHAVTGIDWILALPLALAVLAALGAGGHRCVTVVQHWH